jgi:hypothetical protein
MNDNLRASRHRGSAPVPISSPRAWNGSEMEGRRQGRLEVVGGDGDLAHSVCSDSELWGVARHVVKLCVAVCKYQAETKRISLDTVYNGI